ncbi:MAG: hypothetical protein ACI9VN_001990, partial [Patescibacteria group bacterium]
WRSANSVFFLPQLPSLSQSDCRRRAGLNGGNERNVKFLYRNEKFKNE